MVSGPEGCIARGIEWRERIESRRYLEPLENLQIGPVAMAAVIDENICTGINNAGVFPPIRFRPLAAAGHSAARGRVSVRTRAAL
jgi:hypothetical protein